MKPLLIDDTLTLFSGEGYTQFELETGKLLTPEPLLIAGGWAIPFRRIDAAVYWVADTVYFLQAMQVIRYTVSTGRVDPGYPKMIPFYWQGLWVSDIDAVLRVDKEVYFFRKNQYIQYDLANRQASWHSAQPISKRWCGLPKRVTGAVPLPDNFILFFSDSDCYLYNRQQNKTVAGPLPFSDVIQDGITALIGQFSRQTKQD